MVFLKLLIGFEANFGVNHCVYLEAVSSFKIDTSADVFNQYYHHFNLFMGSFQPLSYKIVNIPLSSKKTPKNIYSYQNVEYLAFLDFLSP